MFDHRRPGNRDATVDRSTMIQLAAQTDPRPLPEILKELSVDAIDEIRAAVLIDLPERWQRQTPVRVEQYLDWFPELRQDPAAVLDVIYAEWLARESDGSAATLEEFCLRFPELADELRKLASVHEVLIDVDGSERPHLPSASRSLSPRRDWAPGPSGVPGYELIRKLGRGGFGEVWEARGPGNVPLALKRVSLSDDCGESERAALDLLKHIRHPHLLSLHAYWTLGSELIMAFELADESLQSLLERDHASGMSPETAACYLTDAAEALDFLARPIHRVNSHAVRIQHRDVKPANLLLQGGAVKVADYGLARALEYVVAQQQSSLTVPYAPPEFFCGETTSTSDQYSLGVTYYELRTGRRPFEGSVSEIIEGHLHGTPRLDGLIENERSVVARALAKDPEQRWAGCIKFMGEVRSSFQPIEVRGPSAEDSNVPKYRGIPLTTGLLISDGDQQPLPLIRTDVRAGITAATAETSVTQVFVNRGDRPIEATYVFPLPEDAAVHRLLMTVGERTIEGVVQEKQEARQAYEQARQQGDGAALVEQTTPNIFTNSVANILPGQKIKIEIRYLQPLPFQEGQYRFVFPMVVSPRYALGESEMAETMLGAVPEAIRRPYLPPRIRRGDTVTLQVDLDAGVPLCGFDSPSHDIVVIEESGESRVRIQLRNQDEIPNRDFVLNYRVAGPRIEHALFCDPDSGGEAGTFLLLTTPPSIHGATRQPREVIVVLDRSGSMGGEPLEQAKQAVKQLIERLEPDDRFNIIAFDDQVMPFAGAPLEASSPNLRRALKFLDKLQSGGGTEMLEPLRMALHQPQGEIQRPRSVVFLTDGSVFGERELLQALRATIGSTRIICFGIGTAVNRHLMNKLAATGRGFAEYIYPGENIARVVDRTLSRLSHTILTDIELDWSEPTIEQMTPERCPDLYREQPLFVLGRYQGKLPNLTIRGRLGTEPYADQVPVQQVRQHEGGVPLRALWARQQIEALMDRIWEHPEQQEQLKQEVITLAIEHRLASEFTSLVAIEYRSDAEREQAREAVRVEIPQHLPEGMFGAADARLAGSSGFSSNSIHAKIDRVRKPRCHVTYDAECSPEPIRRLVPHRSKDRWKATSTRGYRPFRLWVWFVIWFLLILGGGWLVTSWLGW